MTDFRTDTAVFNGARKLSKPLGLTVLVTELGAFERLEVADRSVLLFRACAVADGLGRPWLCRRDSDGINAVSLVGQIMPIGTTELVAGIQTR
jgi:hypothetical protein